jgi:WD40 repeat protein
MLSCGFDRTLRIWSRKDAPHLVHGGAPAPAAAGTLADWRCENVLVGHNDAVLCCAFAPQRGSSPSGVVASACRDGHVRAWRLADVPKFSSADAAALGLPGLY